MPKYKHASLFQKQVSIAKDKTTIINNEAISYLKYSPINQDIGLFKYIPSLNSI